MADIQIHVVEGITHPSASTSIVRKLLWLGTSEGLRQISLYSLPLELNDILFSHLPSSQAPIYPVQSLNPISNFPVIMKQRFSSLDVKVSLRSTQSLILAMLRRPRSLLKSCHQLFAPCVLPMSTIFRL